ncbi:MAG TPA: ATP-binding protein [Rhizomicrobium sp.]|jgi:PAS domain S-box-containing protein
MDEAPRSTLIVVNSDAAVLAIGRTAVDVMTVPAGQSLRHCVHPDDRDLLDLMIAASPGRIGREAAIRLRWSQGGGGFRAVVARFRAAGLASIEIAVEADEANRVRRDERQMRRVVEGSAQGIVVRTANDVLYMNESFARLLGYSSIHECMTGQAHVDSSIHPEDRARVLHHLNARVSGREVVSHYDFRLVRRDGSVIWVETHAATVNWDGRPASLSWLSDVSARKGLETELRESKERAELSNRAKTDFLANMSHELRTPLNAILGFSEVMSRKLFGPIDNRYAEYANDIHRSGQHLLELVNDVLDLAKLEAGKLELRESDIDLGDLVDDVVTLMRNRADAARVELRTSGAAALPALRADRRLVKQVLLNLLSNAIKFTPEDGTVSLDAGCDGMGQIWFRVTDTGIGMSESEIEIAMSPFGQIDSKLARQHEGTGLGLPICRSLLRLHSGELLVASRPGQGTSLTAHFPAHRTVSEAQVANL